MLKRLYAGILALAVHRHATWWLTAIAFAEASVFPIAPDLLLAAMAGSRPRRAWWQAAACTLGSVAGGALGWWIGHALFDLVARPVIDAYGYGPRFEAFRALYAQYGVWVILLKGLTPIPYKLVTIASGAAGFSFPLFMAASLVTRGARFFLVAAIARRFGPAALAAIERRLGLAAAIGLASVILGLLLLRLV